MKRAGIHVIALARIAVPVVLAAVVSPAQASESLSWTLSQDNPRRTCPLTLRFDTAGAAGDVAMPAGCRRAVPAVRQAASWTMGDGGQIRINDAGGQTLLAFERQPDGFWRAAGPAGSGLVLKPAEPTAAEAGAIQAIAADPSDGAIALAPAPADPLAPAPRITQIAATAAAAKPMGAAVAKDEAGRYAVMRGERDTGCMVTLDADTRGAKGGFRARLAPACRDQGIIIFDPLGWQVKGAALVLTARKGHTISLEKDANGTWMKLPKDAKALGLKRL